jgi:hypothetical protein
MNPRRRRKNQSESAPTQPDYLEGFLAEPADVGTSDADADADVAAVAKADADRAAEQVRISQFVRTEEVFDRNAPRPSVRDTPR